MLFAWAWEGFEVSCGLVPVGGSLQVWAGGVWKIRESRWRVTKLKSLRASVVLLGLIGFFFCGMGALADADVDLEVIRCPDDGIQPRGLVDDEGTIHLIYYKREGENGDLFYVTRRDGAW